jgi:multidrug resistance efflux pump
LLLGGLLVCAIGLATYAIWNHMFGDVAYGTIDGLVVRIVAPCDGVTRANQVHEGESVRQGQLLTTIDDLALEQELARLRDDLRIARATLDAELAKLRWNMQLAGNRPQDRATELHELWEKLAGDKAALGQLQWHPSPPSSSGQTNESPNTWENGHHGATWADDADFETRDIPPTWLEETAGPGGAASGSHDGPLRPTLARIRELQAEIQRKQRQLTRGQLRSPLSGIVIKKHRHSGERVEQADPLMEILEEGSLVAVVFFPQDQAERIELGDRGRHGRPVQ